MKDAAAEPNAETAEQAGLVYVHEDDPGITRKGAGAGFYYVDAAGHTIRDQKTLDRIRKLAIPPAYRDVWISPNPRGHIQATGRDDRGRKQYRYHEQWRAARDGDKYEHMAAFGAALPKIRARVEADLRKHALSHDKVVAAVIALLELTLIRVGNEQYAKDNKSFGLTTMRNRHVKVAGEGLKFEFKGKSGVKHQTGFRDRRLARVVKSLQDIPGQRLFQYYAPDGEKHAIGSADVNAYLHDITGEHFTAKDFRTWAGTLAAAKALAMQPPPANEREAKHLTALCVKATAGLLGNTPAVCRSAYIHPAVLQAFSDQTLPAAFAKAEGSKFEAAVLKFLRALVQTEERQRSAKSRGSQAARKLKTASRGRP